MKNLKIIITNALAFTFLLFIYSCQQEEITVNEKTGVEFSLMPGAVTGAENGRMADQHIPPMVEPGMCDLGLAEYAMVEINGSDSYQLPIKQWGENYKTNLLELTPGDYQVTKFIVYDADDNALFATPGSGSDYENFVSASVPIDFTVENYQKMEKQIEVLCIENFTPPEFGFAFWNIDLKETMQLCLFVNYCDPDEGHKVAPVEGIVYASDQEENMIWSSSSNGAGDLLCLRFPYDPGEELADQNYWVVLYSRGIKLVGWINLESIKDINESDSPYLHINENCEGDLSPFEIEKDIELETFMSGLLSPSGIEIGPQGNLWIAEGGTGNDDGRVSLITLDGTMYTVLDNMPSAIYQGEVVGPTHLVFKDGKLYVTVGQGEIEVEGEQISLLYILDISSYTPGDGPLTSDKVEIEDLAPFIVAYDFENDTDGSNIYNLIFGPDGDLYIADAGANAIIKRETNTGELEVIAEIPPVPNPTAIGPPFSDAVPTGLIFKNGDLLVSALTGFPFVSGNAKVFKVTLDGSVEIYQDGLTSAVDITHAPLSQIMVLEYAEYDLATSQFLPGTGKVIGLNAGSPEEILTGLDFPTSIHFDYDGSFYLTDFINGDIIKADF